MFKITLFLALLALPGIGRGETPTAAAADKAAPGQATEYKVLAESGAAVKKIFGLAKPDKARNIYFYDTAALELYGRGLVLRARAGAEKGDTTVKMRPAPAAIPPQVSADEGFKCEYDRTMKNSVYACSLTGKEPPADIEAAGQGTLKIKKLFSGLQEQWAGAAPWPQLLALGPVKSESWEIESPAFGELAFESWTLPGGRAFFEISFRASAGQGSVDDKIKYFHQELARLGVKLAADQSSKTYAAMRYFSKR